MKTLSEQVSFKGQTETITISDFRSRPGAVLMQVELGKSFDITRNGKIVATIAPPEPNAFELGKAAREAGIVKG